ncbi:MAG TPA: hypothetical protein VK174_15715 [Chitinophagales bacterium]|nr:hypothetical protein [Chitinophagales bacterium]
MKTNSIFSKLAVVAAGLMLFSSCSKNEDVAPNNIMQYRNESSQSQTLDVSEINTDMVLEDRVNGVDYTITGNVQVNANLTIRPGVTIMFKDNAGIQVNAQGSLTAIGSNGNLILFTSESGRRSAWKGITVLSSNARNVISYSKIEHGGAANSFGSGNIIVGSGANSAAVEISHSEITASGTDAIVVSEGSKLNGFTGNKVHTNSAFPLNIHITDAGSLSDGNQFVNNGKEFIKVSGTGSINKQINLKKLDASFLISGTITAANKFCIAAGSRVYMDNGAKVVIDGASGQGSFCAVGTATSPISIAAIYNGNGIWKNIEFLSSNSNDNKIEYCTISGGGATEANHAEGMITVVNDGDGSSNIVIRNSTIINSAAIGIYIQNQGSEYNSDIISGNVFSNNVKGNVHIE